jgi:hypothetical protein
MDQLEPSPPGAPGVSACSVCAAPLASDQRYCVTCGERRGPLPASVAAMLGLGVTPELDADGIAPDHAAGSWLGIASVPGPPAAAIAVMAILAFGVLIGSVVSPPAESATGPTLIAVSPPAASAPSPVVEPPTTSAPAASTAAPVQQTVTQTIAAPATPPAAPVPEVPATPQLPPIKHVFLIVLSEHGYDAAFGPNSQAPYLASTLTKQGELLTNYYGVAQGGLANAIALVSGQGPNPDTVANCPTYGDITPGKPDQDPQQSGQVLGSSGCVYPPAAITLPDELLANGNTWKAYVEDMGNGPAGQPTTCRHPALGTTDENHDPRPGDAYVTWRNPFAYFHSIVDAPTCADTVVGLDRLDSDIGSAASTPSLSYIVPNRCHDAAEAPCAPDAPAGLPAADAFLKTLVPRIMSSPGYKDGGMIAITFDAAPHDGPAADSSACCAEPAYPNLPAATPATTTQTTPATATTPGDTGTTPAPAPTPGDTSTTPAPATTPPATTSPLPPGADSATGGGGRVGLLLITPFVKAGTVNSISTYNHFSLLRSIEDLFALQPTGYAGYPGVLAFDSVIYNAAAKSG